jgi:endonuclease/exonuclease/phosphatase family metal-dependent hydrolase
MTTFLFWNLMGNQEANWPARMAALRTHIVQMALSFGVDVFMFAESSFDPSELVAALNHAKVGRYCYPPSRNERLQIITRFKRSALVNQYDSEDGRLTIRRLTTMTTKILLAVIHFQSQMNWTPTDQAFQATVVRENILQTEETVGHQRTILAGDLNMNPFDPGLVGAQALNAVMTRDLARAEERTVAKQNYRLFYNPMWGHFGDRTSGPPGTYYYSASAPVNYFWNVFDQVLLRPDLMDALDEVRILDTDGQVSLLTTNGRPRSSEASDHLPILFRLNI